MARKPLIIEARINEYRPRRENRHIPYTAEEIFVAGLSRAMGREVATVAQTREPRGL